MLFENEGALETMIKPALELMSQGKAEHFWLLYKSKGNDIDKDFNLALSSHGYTKGWHAVDTLPVLTLNSARSYGEAEAKVFALLESFWNDKRGIVRKISD